MSSRVAILSAADSAYFSLLDDLLTSMGPQAYGDFFVLDLGLNGKQKDVLRGRHEGLKLVNIPYQENPQLAQSNMYKTKLPEFVPGYEMYVWIDADIWFQDVTVIAGFLALAPNQEISIVGEAHPSYRHGGKEAAWLKDTYGAMFGPGTAQIMLGKTTMNAGIFAARGGSSLWGQWHDLLSKQVETLPRDLVSDQGVLNYLIHIGGFKHRPLPPTHNWMTHLAFPVWDVAEQAFCTPDKAKDTIRAIHLTSKIKYMTFTAQGKSGEFKSTLRYSDVERFFKRPRR